MLFNLIFTQLLLKYRWRKAKSWLSKQGALTPPRRGQFRCLPLTSLNADLITEQRCLVVAKITKFFSDFNVLSARDVKEGGGGGGSIGGEGRSSYIVRGSYFYVSFPKRLLRGSLVLAGKPLSGDIID